MKEIENIGKKIAIILVTICFASLATWLTTLQWKRLSVINIYDQLRTDSQSILKCENAIVLGPEQLNGTHYRRKLGEPRPLLPVFAAHQETENLDIERYFREINELGRDLETLSGRRVAFLPVPDSSNTEFSGAAGEHVRLFNSARRDCSESTIVDRCIGLLKTTDRLLATSDKPIGTEINVPNATSFEQHNLMQPSLLGIRMSLLQIAYRYSSGVAVVCFFDVLITITICVCLFYNLKTLRLALAPLEEEMPGLEDKGFAHFGFLVAFLYFFIVIGVKAPWYISPPLFVVAVSACSIFGLVYLQWKRRSSEFSTDRLRSLLILYIAENACYFVVSLPLAILFFQISGTLGPGNTATLSDYHIGVLCWAAILLLYGLLLIQPVVSRHVRDKARIKSGLICWLFGPLLVVGFYLVSLFAPFGGDDTLPDAFPYVLATIRSNWYFPIFIEVVYPRILVSIFLVAFIILVSHIRKVSHNEFVKFLHGEQASVVIFLPFLIRIAIVEFGVVLYPTTKLSDASVDGGQEMNIDGLRLHAAAKKALKDEFSTFDDLLNRIETSSLASISGIGEQYEKQCLIAVELYLNEKRATGHYFSPIQLEATLPKDNWRSFAILLGYLIILSLAFTFAASVVLAYLRV